MEKIQFILGIIVGIYLFLVIPISVWIGHKITMKAFSHVQPSPKEMAKYSKGTVSVDPDYFEEAMKEPVSEISSEKESAIKKLWKKTGLPDFIWDSYKKNGRHPQEFFGHPNPDNDGSEINEVEKEIRKGNFGN